MDMTISLINNISFQIITFHCTTFITIGLSRWYTNFVKLKMRSIFVVINKYLIHTPLNKRFSHFSLQ